MTFHYPYPTIIKFSFKKIGKAYFMNSLSWIVQLYNFELYEIQVSSGVPEELHLGPLVFNVYVNDMLFP